MARSKDPSNVAEFKGAFKAHPERRSDNEPKTIGTLGNAPRYFNDKQKKIWAELKSAFYAGTCGKGDRFSVEIMSVLIYRFRFGTEKDVEPLNSGELSRLIVLLGKFGLNPSERRDVISPEDAGKRNRFNF